MNKAKRDKMIEKLVDIYGKDKKNLETMTTEELEDEYERTMDGDDGGMDPDDYLDSDAADEDYV